MELSYTTYKKSPYVPWLVFIHGFGGSKNMWKKQVAAFRDEYNLLVLELPGHGDAPKDAKNGPYAWGIPEVADGIVRLLREMDIDKAHFVCVSLGTLVMSAIVERHPDVVASVILCGAIFGMQPWHRLALYLGNAFKWILPYQITIQLFSIILMPLKSHKVSRDFLVRECIRLGRAEFLRWYSILSRELGRLKRDLPLFSHTKSLVVMGSEDGVFLRSSIRALWGMPDRLKLRVMRDCGHVCSLQKAEEFNSIMSTFLETPVPESSPSQAS